MTTASRYKLSLFWDFLWLKCILYEKYCYCSVYILGVSCISLMMDLSQYLFEHGISDVRSALGTICYDNLGLQYIVYFSNVETNL